ncbi:uncharacterized mitochondrial protein AtMg00810-like [Telopea speciosissima]|uniref:uncharacterized mitochondrial protein AtMg00810-like n=1 Tax=Telopea speciosissima TaxID=54955 RepID=UPI001CC41F33|nr:uncharacterized mitochondrial protein AtMg00810-like [Telopea speciosissima]
MALSEAGYISSTVDHSLFRKTGPSGSSFVLVYVDDLLITGDDIIEITSLKQHLHRQFQIKDLGDLRYFLGVEVAKTDRGIFLCQRKYTLDILADMGMTACRPAHTPMEQHLKLNPDDGEFLPNPSTYRCLIGRLIYLNFTRPDISYSVQVLSQFMHAPRRPHLDAALHILRYLKTTPGHGIFLSAQSSLQLRAYADSDWASCPFTRCSTTGYCILLGDSPISWRSKKQSTLSLLAESSIVPWCMLPEIQWPLYLLIDLRIPHHPPGATSL